MVVPEHAEIAYADGGHQWADHLVELARRGSKNASECRVPHVKKWLYCRFRHRVALSFALSLVCCHGL
jgi:hypothetical protein